MNLSPKHKALEIVSQHTHHAYTNVFSFRAESNWGNAKKCALITIFYLKEQTNEDIKICEEVNIPPHDSIRRLRYWESVEEEIKKLELPLDDKK